MIGIASKPIAVLRLAGAIMPGRRTNELIAALNRAARTDSIAAVVLELESPGGSAAASDSIYLAAAKVAREKPLIAYAPTLCASGAYLVGCAAHELWTQPAATVGSIGVISLRPIATDLLARLGLSVDVTKSGPLKDMGAFYRWPTETERTKEGAIVQEYFDLFLKRIHEGRGMPMERCREIATGEVFTGQRAVALGLADGLTDLDGAVEVAAKRAQSQARYVRWRTQLPFPARVLRPAAWLEQLPEMLVTRLLSPDAWYL